MGTALNEMSGPSFVTCHMTHICIYTRVDIGTCVSEMKTPYK